MCNRAVSEHQQATYGPRLLVSAGTPLGLLLAIWVLASCSAGHYEWSSYEGRACFFSCRQLNYACTQNCNSVNWGEAWGAALLCYDGCAQEQANCLNTCPDLRFVTRAEASVGASSPPSASSTLEHCGGTVAELDRQLPIVSVVGNEIWVGVNWDSFSEGERAEMARQIMTCLPGEELVVHPAPSTTSKVIGRYPRGGQNLQRTSDSSSSQTSAGAPPDLQACLDHCANEPDYSTCAAACQQRRRPVAPKSASAEQAGQGGRANKAPGPGGAIPVSADYLSRRYLENPLGADQEWKGMWVKVSGTVMVTGVDDLGQRYVVLRGVDGIGVQCGFPRDRYVEYVSTLRLGQLVTLQGECRGKEERHTSVTVEHCEPTLDW